jgi:TetR/AcrR family transcriptional regulator, copper-responsive repressor
MVQKSSAKRRGRPRAYDPDRALDRAMGEFWRAGFSATSLDELSAATGMNRPSLYGAFGDKRALYLETLKRYRDAAAVEMTKALAPGRPLREGLRRVYDMALATYFGGDVPPRGCFLIGTATTEAAGDPEIRALLGATLRALDEGFETRLRLAQQEGELGTDTDPAGLAKIASAVLHTLAVRSRAGDAREDLERTVEAALDVICGRGQPRR